jgi:glycine cleavage system aminomethyltransferase T
MGVSIARAPLHPGVRRSPYFQATDEAGATEYMTYNHMYMPADYGHPAEDYAAVTEGVTLWDVGAERQVEIKGPDALRFADYLVTSDVSVLEAGRCKYTFCCDETGRVICDPVLLVPGQDTVWLSHGNTDLLLWVKAIGLHTSYDAAVSEPDISPMQVQGPRSRELLRKLVGAEIEQLRYYRCAVHQVAGTDVVISRTGWSGGLGYELFPLVGERSLDVWNAVREVGESVGLVLAGPNVPRAMESGVTDSAYYSTFGANALEMGRPHLVDLEKGPYVGREALRQIAADGPARATVGLLGPGERLPRAESVWRVMQDGTEVGLLRWATFSPALERAIAIAMVNVEAAEAGAEVNVVYPEGEAVMVVTTLPFVDLTGTPGDPRG